MNTSILFGNGFNRAVKSTISWDGLLKKLMRGNKFDYEELPNTMTYERIFLERRDKAEELKLKNEISEMLASTPGNELYIELEKIGCSNYLTTNYDYAFEESIGMLAVPRSTEEVYSIRRFREFYRKEQTVRLWSLHGEILHPKSIMLGLDHYCGSIGKLDSYIKGNYTIQKDGKLHHVQKMEEKIKNGSYCHSSWVDLFFSSDLHIIGLSLDYSETDLWWVLNKRARLSQTAPLKNKIYFHSTSEKPSKIHLLQSFGVEIRHHKVKDNDYIGAYRIALQTIREISKPTQSRRVSNSSFKAELPA